VRKQFQDESAARKTSNLLILMPTIHHLICAKKAMRHFSKASVYDSGNRQWVPRVRAMYMCDVDRAGQNKIESVCIWGDLVQN
jgi:hypothetical protein